MQPLQPGHHTIVIRLGSSRKAEARTDKPAGESCLLFATPAQPGSEDTMEWDGSWVRTRSSNQLPILQVCECALDGAPGESCGAGD